MAAVAAARRSSFLNLMPQALHRDCTGERDQANVMLMDATTRERTAWHIWKTALVSTGRQKCHWTETDTTLDHAVLT